MFPPPHTVMYVLLSEQLLVQAHSLSNLTAVKIADSSGPPRALEVPLPEVLWHRTVPMRCPSSSSGSLPEGTAGPWHSTRQMGILPQVFVA